MGVLGRLVRLDGLEGEVEVGGVRIRAAVAAEGVKPGDVVLVHAGVVLEKLDRRDVVANVALYYDLMKYHYVLNGMTEEEARRRALDDLRSLARDLGVDVGELIEVLGETSERERGAEPAAQPGEMPPGAFHVDYAVQLAETDYLQVMHYTNYIRVCERAFMMMLSSAGISYSRLIHEYGVFVPTVEVSAKIKSPCRLDNLLRVYVWLEEVGRKHLKYRCLVYNVTSGRVAADITHVAVCTDTAITASHEIPTDVRKILEGLIARQSTATA